MFVGLKISDSLFSPGVSGGFILLVPSSSDVRMPFENRRLILSCLAVVALFRRVSASLKPMRYPASAVGLPR
jgi:hypothetical protein